jgi:diguanylate cyclase (GGDEF)-like protein
MLTSFAFAVMFGAIWARNGRAPYMLHWAASAALYSVVLELFDHVDPQSAIARSVAFGLMSGTDVLILIGVRSFAGRSRYSAGEVCLLAAILLVPMLAAGVAASARLPVGASAEVCMTALLVAKVLVGSWVAFDRGEQRSFGQRLAGLAMLAYVPVYALSIVAAFIGLGELHLGAVLPMVADQLLLAAMNIALMSMPTERATRDLRKRVLRDPLTGVHNRAWLEDYKAGQHRTDGAVIIVDIDHFKRINDRYGHAAGDEVLTRFAATASELLEPEHGMLARLGGDEFIAILPEADVERASEVAENLLKTLRRRRPGAPRATASFGIGVATAGDDLSCLMARADRGLYAAKAAGRDCVAIG